MKGSDTYQTVFEKTKYDSCCQIKTELESKTRGSGYRNDAWAKAVAMQAGVEKREFMERSIKVLPEDSNDGIAFTLVQSHKACLFHLPRFSHIVCVCVGGGCNIDMWVKVLKFNQSRCPSKADLFKNEVQRLQHM